MTVVFKPFLYIQYLLFYRICWVNNSALGSDVVLHFVKSGMLHNIKVIVMAVLTSLIWMKTSLVSTGCLWPLELQYVSSDSDTNLTIVCRHRWSRQMTMKVDKYLKLSARTAVFISWRGRLKYLSTFIVIYLLQRCLQTIVRLVSLSVLHFNIFSNI